MALCACSGCTRDDDDAGIACDASAIDGGTVSDASITVPLTTYASGGTRFAVVVDVNGVPVTAELDTGSAGLRVLASALLDAGVADGGASATQHYNGGTYLLGYETEATVALGGLAMPAVPMQVVTCVNTTGNPAICDPNPSIFGQQAILGIGLRTSPSPAIRSPLAFLSDRRSFFVHMTAADGVLTTNAGYLQLGVTPKDYDSFTVFDLAPSPVDAGGATPFWIDYSIASCVQDVTDHGNAWCSGTLFDTGDPSPYVETSDVTAFATESGGHASPYPIPNGSTVRVSIDGPACSFDRYAVDADVQIRLLDAGAFYNNLSQHVFYRYDVMFDQAAGKIGLRAR